MLLSDVTMTLIRQNKIGNIFFLEQQSHMFPLENEYTSLLPRNAHGTYNTACTINFLYNIVPLLEADFRAENFEWDDWYFMQDLTTEYNEDIAL